MASTRYIVAENLKRVLADKKIGSNRCADAAGVSRSQFYDVLAARKGATIDWLERVAHELDTEVWKLTQPRKRKGR
jgi:DNA-binding Xre family transcriptional regulator